MILTVAVVGDGDGSSSSRQTRGSIARRLSEIKNITKLPVTMFKAATAAAWAAREQVHMCVCMYVHIGTCINHAREGER